MEFKSAINSLDLFSFLPLINNQQKIYFITVKCQFPYCRSKMNGNVFINFSSSESMRPLKFGDVRNVHRQKRLINNKHLPAHKRLDAFS